MISSNGSHGWFSSRENRSGASRGYIKVHSGLIDQKLAEQGSAWVCNHHVTFASTSRRRAPSRLIAVMPGAVVRRRSSRRSALHRTDPKHTGIHSPYQCRPLSRAPRETRLPHRGNLVPGPSRYTTSSVRRQRAHNLRQPGMWRQTILHRRAVVRACPT